MSQEVSLYSNTKEIGVLKITGLQIIVVRGTGLTPLIICPSANLDLLLF